MQSGGCNAMPRADAKSAGGRLASNAGCGGAAADVVACLRAKTPAELLRALPPNITGLSTPDFGPSLDGVVLPRAPAETLRLGLQQPVPFVVGSNREETSRMLPPPAQIATPQQYEAAARTFLSQFAWPSTTVDRVLAAYPASSYTSPHAALVALTTDVRWTCPARTYLRNLAANPAAAVYRYYFTHTLDAARAPAASRFGSYHGLEFLYVFGTLEIAGYRPTDADRALSRRIQGYWSRFAATGDPNGDGAVRWPRYLVRTDSFLELREPPVEGTGVRTTECDTLEAALSGAGN